MEQSPSWEANSHSASQEIFLLLWNSKVHHRVHKSPQLVPVVAQMNPVHTFPLRFPKIQSIHFPFSRSFQRIRPATRPHVEFRNKLFILGWGFVIPSLNLQAARPLLFGCPQLLIQYIPSCHPYLQVVSSVSKPGRAMVTDFLIAWKWNP
jgi:hypothetical protein